jgi:hypothetical protein
MIDTPTTTDTVVAKFRAFEDETGWTYRGLRVDGDLRTLRPWLESFPGIETALTELHAAMLRKATQGMGIAEDFTPAAAVIFGLARAVQCGTKPLGGASIPRRAEIEDAVLRCVAHALAAITGDSFDPDRDRHLEMSRSWMAQAYLLVGVEGGAR